MLAAASIGAVWSSCSPDFGEQGVLDRFGQIEPVVFIAPRRLLVQRQADRRRRQARRRSLAKLPTVRKRPDRRLSRHGRARRPRPSPSAVALDEALAPFAAEAGHLRAAAVRSSALHPVLVRHDRRAEMHRAFGRRHAAPASQGASAACRRRARRPLLLLHHLRLDDVELAGLRPRLRRDAAAL